MSLSPVGERNTCGGCRYFVHRHVGTVNTGLSVSNWGYCEGHRNRDLTGRGASHIGMVHKSMRCQLPNIGLPEDWKPRYRIPQSARPVLPWEMVQKRNNSFIDRENTYMREWALEK